MIAPLASCTTLATSRVSTSSARPPNSGAASRTSPSTTAAIGWTRPVVTSASRSRSTASTARPCSGIHRTPARASAITARRARAASNPSRVAGGPATNAAAARPRAPSTRSAFDASVASAPLPSSGTARTTPPSSNASEVPEIANAPRSPSPNVRRGAVPWTSTTSRASSRRIATNRPEADIASLRG
ncbi:MAG: hypothetical protein ABI467_02975 [Kofleriaceae bacterium]